MACSYGDYSDLRLFRELNLKGIIAIDQKGKMTEVAGPYKGLTVEEARQKIIQDLQNKGLIAKQEKIIHRTPICWRSEDPVEFIEMPEYYLKQLQFLDDIRQVTEKIRFYPKESKQILDNWINSITIDWPISRRRFYGTEIPIWYCKKCGEVILAKETWVPIDPKLEKPRIEKCPKCGTREFNPERDVFDTWMDSSITCAVHAGWPDRSDWRRFFPADVHPSGIDIIRTWAYYLMVRHLALFNEKPYKSCLINGMVLGSDGRKMSKSLKNYVAAPEVLGKYGSDATRQWAAGGGATGSDIPFRWPDVEYGKRFLVKLWNVSGFTNKLLMDYAPGEAAEFALQPLDKWVLSKAEKLTQKVSEAMEKCQFNVAVEEVRNFTWHTFCDCYVEAVKDRLYRSETHGAAKKAAAQHALYEVLYRVLQLLAPMTPHLTEEIYQAMYADGKGYRSLQLSPWPEFDQVVADEEAEKRGDLIIAVITEVRREKAEKRMPLNAPIKKLMIYAGNQEAAEMIKAGAADINGTCKVESLEVHAEKGSGREIAQYPDVHFVTEY